MKEQILLTLAAAAVCIALGAFLVLIILEYKP